MSEIREMFRLSRGPHTNTFVQVKTSYDIRQSLTAFGYLDQSTSAAQRPKETVTSKVCFTEENGKKVCQ